MSPNVGLIGAPHAGHLSSWTPAAAIVGDEGAAGGAAGAAPPWIGVPHFMQNWAVSGTWVPHFMQ
jgi:hypothetical protein